MSTTPNFEKPAELTVYDTSLELLTDTGWSVQDGPRHHRGELSIELGTPDSLRLLSMNELAAKLDIDRGNGWLKAGFAFERDADEDRIFVRYEGPFDLTVVQALVGAVALSDIKAPEWAHVSA